MNMTRSRMCILVLVASLTTTCASRQALKRDQTYSRSGALDDIGQDHRTPPSTISASTNANGLFEVPVQPGNVYSVRFQAVGFVTVLYERVHVSVTSGAVLRPKMDWGVGLRHAGVLERPSEGSHGKIGGYVKDRRDDVVPNVSVIVEPIPSMR